MRGSKEIVGTLRGFDDYGMLLGKEWCPGICCHLLVCLLLAHTGMPRIAIHLVNLVLDDAIEFSPDPRNANKYIKTELNTEILLNGNQIAVLVPGGTGPSADSISA